MVVKNFVKWLFNIKSKTYPKKIIAFTSHGCMGEKIQFKWIGIVTNEYTSEDGVDFYDVKVIIGQSESSHATSNSIEKAWQINKLTDNLYIHYI